MSDDRGITIETQWTEPSRRLQAIHRPAQHTFIDLWKVIRRRRLVLAAVALSVVIAGVLYAALSPRLYKSEAELQILKQDELSDFGDPGQASSSAAADALDFNLAVQTQVDILESRNLALQVIRELRLDETPDYSLAASASESGKPLEQSPRRMAYAIDKFEKRLRVSSISGTRLLSVGFLDRNPQRAAQVVNQLVADFIEYSYQVRYAASSKASSVLGDELRQMKDQVDEQQANVVKLQQQSGIYGVDENNNAVIAKLEQLNAQLTAAQANLALKRSIYQLAITRSPEVLAGMIGAQATGANTTNAPLQLLRQQQAEAAASFAELNSHYGAEYPKVIQARQKLDSIQASIDSEIDRLVGQATAEFKVASDTEAAAAAALADQEGKASQMDHDAILYTSAKHEADTSRDLYEQLFKRLKEAGALAGMHPMNISILDPAVPSDKPAQPMLLMYSLLACGAGLLAGIFAVFAAEAYDDTVRDPQKIEDVVRVPVLALIPPTERSLPSIVTQSLQRNISAADWQYQTTAKAPKSSVAEAFRVLRTAVASGLHSKQPRILGITSTSEAEGKSFTTFNLAAAFAQSGRRVVVVDADLRKRSLTKALGLEQRSGLVESLAEIAWLRYITAYDATPGLFVLPAGQPGYFSPDTLGSENMTLLLGQLRNSFDVVLVDTPSLMPVSDTMSLATAVDALIVVAKCGRTPLHSLVRSHAVLRRAGARLLGVVLNGIDLNSSDSYYYWGKQGRGYQATTAQMLALPARSMPSAAKVVASLLLVWVTAGACRAAAQAVAQNPSSMVAIDSYQKLVIGRGDLLSVSVFDAPELAQDARVNPDGSIHLQLLGDVNAAGLAPTQLAANLERELARRNLILSPQVSVAIKEFNTQGVTVEGEVRKPGVYPIYSSRSLIDVIAMAEGETASADIQISIRRHATNQVESVILPQNSGRQTAAGDIRVDPGDTVIVPRAGLAYVLGDVARPGGYIMRDNGSMTILQAVSEAQGTTRNASLNHVVLLRRSNTGTETIPVPLKEIMRGKKKDQELMNGDILFVPSSALKNFAQNTEGITASMAGAVLYVAAN